VASSIRIPPLAGRGFQHGHLIVVPGGDQRSRFAQPEARVLGEAQPQFARDVGVATGFSTLGTDAEVPEVADRGTDRRVGAVDDDHAQAAPDRSKCRAEADDP
jgi:hypothetical protein